MEHEIKLYPLRILSKDDDFINKFMSSWSDLHLHSYKRVIIKYTKIILMLECDPKFWNFSSKFVALLEVPLFDKKKGIFLEEDQRR